MLKYVLIGSGFAFAAAIQPGPLQAFYLSRVAAGGWRRTLPAALAPVISDGPIALVILTVLGRLPAGFENYLKGAGGLLLFYFAGKTFLEWRRGIKEGGRETQSAPRTLFQAVAVNAVNPGPYLGWSLVLGPTAIEAWSRSPAHAVALVAAFYLTMVTTLALFILLLGTTSYLGPRGRRALLLVAAVALVGLGIYQLTSAVGWLGPGVNGTAP